MFILQVHLTHSDFFLIQEGSRIYGVHSETSDWDFICVVDTEKSVPGLTVVESGQMNLGRVKGWQRANMLQIFTIGNTSNSWSNKMLFGSCVVLFCQKTKFWKMTALSSLSWESPVLQNFQQDFDSLSADLLTVAQKDAEYTWRKAKRLWNQSNRTAKKNLVHGLRYSISVYVDSPRSFLRFALQLAVHSKIVDFTDGNDYWSMVSQVIVFNS